MVYRLISHAGCCRKSRAAGELSDLRRNSSSVLPTSHVVYQPINHRNLSSIAFIIIQKTRDFSMSSLAQKTIAD